jgi:hypothetical protein
MNYITYSHKSITARYEFEPFFELPVKTKLTTGRQLVGRLVAISDKYLTLRFRDGRETEVRCDQIAAISGLLSHNDNEAV